MSKWLYYSRKTDMKLIMAEVGQTEDRSATIFWILKVKKISHTLIVGYLFIPFFFLFSSSSQLHIYRSLNQQHPWVLFTSYSWDLILENQTDYKLSPWRCILVSSFNTMLERCGKKRYAFLGWYIHRMQMKEIRQSKAGWF